MQKLVNGEWVEFSGDLVVGDIYRTPIGGEIVNGELVGNGWEQKAYSLPVVEPVIAIRKITKRAFMQRFTQPERTLIRKSTDDIVIDIYEDLQSVTRVELDMTDTVNDLYYAYELGE